MIGVFKLETQMISGSGKFERTGLGSNSKAKESVDNAFKYLKANSKNISGNISTITKDYLVHVQDLNGIGMTSNLTLPTIIAICSVALGKPVIPSMAVLGDVSIGGTLLKAEELANTLQVCLNSGAKRVLLPLTSAADLTTVPPELVGSFNLIFYKSAEYTLFKTLGVE